MIELPIYSLKTDYRPSVTAMEFHESLQRFRFLCWGIKSGKCILADQKVLMADGSAKMAGDLEIGDRLMGMEGSRGKPTTVTGLESAQKQSFEIEFADGSKVRCSQDHRFPVWNYKLRRVQTWPLNQILRSDGKAKAKYKFIKPRNVEFGREELPIDPYFLGLLLGDGCIVKVVEFSTASEELLEAITGFAADWGLKTNPTSGYDYHLSSGAVRDAGGHNFNPLLRALDHLGLKGRNSHTKFIPKIYLRSSLSNRLRILAGLIDTDGYVYNKSRVVEYCTMSWQLSRDVQFLVRSVGGFASIRVGDVGQYRLGITLNREIPTRIPYKKLAPIKRDKTRIGLSGSRDIGVQDCVHISVSAANELFLLDNFVATHNTRAGAAECLRSVLSKPNSLNWVVAPTYRHVDVAASEVLEVLSTVPDLSWKRTRGHTKQLVFPNGAVLQFQSAEKPDNLRGPGIDGILWADEASYMSQEAWMILRGRIVAHEAEVLVTTTPQGRDWFYDELRLAGMPAEAPYGEFSKGNRWVSHQPTWHFPWVTGEEIEDARRSMSAAQFDQEFGAKFMAFAGRVFMGVEKSLSLEPLPLNFDGETIMGLDLGKNQDYTAVLILTGAGRMLFADKWNRAEWGVTKGRIRNLAREWKASVVMDTSNVGSVIYDDLRGEDFPLFPVAMHSPDVKNDLIESLKLAFESGAITLVSPKCRWCLPVHEDLVEEIFSYEAKLTPSGRISYSAPKGSHDDLVIALALANWGRTRGMASAESAQVVFTREEMAELTGENDRDTDLRLGRRFARFTRAPRIDGGRGRPRSMFGGRNSGSLWESSL